MLHPRTDKGVLGCAKGVQAQCIQPAILHLPTPPAPPKTLRKAHLTGQTDRKHSLAVCIRSLSARPRHAQRKQEHRENKLSSGQALWSTRLCCGIFVSLAAIHVRRKAMHMHALQPTCPCAQSSPAPQAAKASSRATNKAPSGPKNSLLEGMIPRAGLCT